MPPLAQILLAITPMRSLSGSNGAPQDRPKKGYSFVLDDVASRAAAFSSSVNPMSYSISLSALGFTYSQLFEDVCFSTMSEVRMPL